MARCALNTACLTAPAALLVSALTVAQQVRKPTTVDEDKLRRRMAREMVVGSAWGSTLSTTVIIPLVEEICFRAAMVGGANLVRRKAAPDSRKAALVMRHTARVICSGAFAIAHMLPADEKQKEAPRMVQALVGKRQTAFQVSMWNCVRIVVLFVDSFATSCPLYESSGLWASAGDHMMWNALMNGAVFPGTDRLHTRGLGLAGRLAQAKTASMALRTTVDLALLWILLNLSCTGVATALELN